MESIEISAILWNVCPEKELNKRTIENFIKAGALDGLCDNRKQLMMIYVQVVDSVNQEKKKCNGRSDVSV